MAARPIWSGTLSFGLLNIPVSLMAGERRVDLHFRMLDARNNAPVRYERVNAETGEEVPWKEIVKAFEYDKDSYVVLEPADIRNAAPESHETVEIDTFVPAEAVPPQFFERPYFLVPARKAEKGYVLLRETLKRTGRIGIARVVIRTREYLCAVLPQGDALVLLLMRWPQELVSADSLSFPTGSAATHRISAAELKMAEQLIGSMSRDWQPKSYKDEFRERLTEVIQQRMKSKGVVAKKPLPEADEEAGTSTNVVDFMALLQQSLSSNKRSPAKKAAAANDAVTGPKPKPKPKPAAKKTTSSRRRSA
jgi:DNA end-binding protein Ku